MRREELGGQVRDELARIPRGGLDQNVFRAIYNMQRRRDLSRDSFAPPRASIDEAIRLARIDRPEFDPNFDETYFAR